MIRPVTPTWIMIASVHIYQGVRSASCHRLSYVTRYNIIGERASPHFALLLCGNVQVRHCIRASIAHAAAQSMEASQLHLMAARGGGGALPFATPVRCTSMCNATRVRMMIPADWLFQEAEVLQHLTSCETLINTCVGSSNASHVLAPLEYMLSGIIRACRIAVSTVKGQRASTSP
jgi:hypothetical protein